MSTLVDQARKMADVITVEFPGYESVDEAATTLRQLADRVQELEATIQESLKVAAPVQPEKEERRPLSDEKKRELLNGCGFVTGPNLERTTGRLYRSMGTPANAWEAHLFELIDRARGIGSSTEGGGT